MASAAKWWISFVMSSIRCCDSGVFYRISRKESENHVCGHKHNQAASLFLCFPFISCFFPPLKRLFRSEGSISGTSQRAKSETEDNRTTAPSSPAQSAAASRCQSCFLQLLHRRRRRRRSQRRPGQAGPFPSQAQGRAGGLIGPRPRGASSGWRRTREETDEC